MKRLRTRIQCKCQACGKVWMDSRQWSYCPDCAKLMAAGAAIAKAERCNRSHGDKTLQEIRRADK